MKTKKEWDNSKQNLGQFLQVGDVVDDEMYDYFLGVLPPACNSATCLQIGEPYTHSAAGPHFPTLIKKDGQWTYAGNIPTPRDEACVYF